MYFYYDCGNVLFLGEEQTQKSIQNKNRKQLSGDSDDESSAYNQTDDNRLPLEPLKQDKTSNDNRNGSRRNKRKRSEQSNHGMLL